jgi:hypothetical protein
MEGVERRLWRRRQEALDMPIVGGLICTIMSSNASIIEGIRTRNKKVVIFL